MSPRCQGPVGRGVGAPGLLLPSRGPVEGHWRADGAGVQVDGAVVGHGGCRLEGWDCAPPGAPAAAITWLVLVLLLLLLLLLVLSPSGMAQLSDGMVE